MKQSEDISKKKMQLFICLELMMSSDFQTFLDIQNIAQ